MSAASIPQRSGAPWQAFYDERIVERLRDVGLATAEQMAAVRGLPSDAYFIRRRLRALSQAALVKPVKEGSDWYELGPDGEAYLRGNIRADLIVPEPDPRRGHVLG